MIETLTDDERAHLDRWADAVPAGHVAKWRRIIDQLTTALAEARAEVERLERQSQVNAEAYSNAVDRLRAEVARLKEALRAAQTFGNAQEARCRDLDAAADLRAEAAEQKLAAAELRGDAWAEQHERMASRALDAEARVRELESEVLHVVTDADMRVLEAMAKAPDATVSLWAGGVKDTGWLSELGWAELARREAKR